ncbi:AMP1 protein, partial [Setophaga kirtlandii]|nr:AMP1 protein [Setophaga kirtlandii]
MKILFLLFPLILLLIQGAAGNSIVCMRSRRGFCFRDSCPHGTYLVGRCSPGRVCCRR